jgi:fatty-acyl-CoA synthase
MNPAVPVPSTTSHPGTGRPGSGANKAWLRALDMTARIDRAPDRLLSSVVEEIAETRPDAPALLSDGESLTYGALAGRIRRYARWALAEGLAKGEVVALMMPNRPEYMAVWLGLASVGVVVALINTNLRGAALAHCLDVAAPKRLIASPQFADAARDAASRLSAAPEIWLHGDGEGARIDRALAALPDNPLSSDERRGVTVRDPALLIYTSGTTGLPKAARVSHHRVMSWSGWFAGMMDAGPDDRLYDSLPMHHSVGGVVATGAMLIKGGAVVIAARFSADRFWDDIVRWDCTLFQYIGELCRYLVKAPTSANERRHRLRMACGNGLRPEVWTVFQERFAIPGILEFYAATEGNFSLYNAEGQPGAIGRVPAFMAHRFPAAIVRFDAVAGAPARGPDGQCQRCAPGEVGEAIGRISGAGGDPAHRFEGYTSAAETEKKVLRDVFEAGDAWLRTGDLMRTDARGFFYFVDRIGDTFRWKGENVATGEVAQAIEACPGVEAAVVYGVVVPDADGRAGMAAIVPGEGFDLAVLRAHLAQALPAYARPLFLRLTPDLAITETFKQKKGDLVAEGFDPGRTSDPLFFDDAGAGAYARLKASLFDAIASGAVRP